MKIRKIFTSCLALVLLLMLCPKNVLAYQPASHYVLMQETMKSLPEGSLIKSAMEKYPDIAAWGANGPDLPLIQPRQVLGYSPWSDRFHYFKIGSFAKNLLQDALAAKDMKRISFAAGWLTHVCGDYACHGIFVNPESGLYLIDPSGRDLHMSLESAADPYLWVNKGGFDSSDYSDGISDCFAEVTDIPFDTFNTSVQNIYGSCPSTLEEKSWCYTLMTGLKTGVGYKYQTYEEANDFLSENNRRERLENSFDSAHAHVVKLLTEAEQGDYSGFTDRWNIDVGLDNNPISSLTVTVHTGNEKRGLLHSEWAGTDDDVYFGIETKDGETKEWLLDKEGYNDFEVDDIDEYYLYNGTDIHPDDISNIYIKKITKHGGIGGDWYLENLDVNINGHSAYNSDIKSWIDEDNSTWKDSVDFSNMDLDTEPIE
ncbi:phospholipase C [Vallitalea longa]|uniref:Phospholipase C n=1 Tax=Vallitalea longa TaxID=2936439 RepID=A0A9W5YCU1_9FIRM|nr:PLAT/LH2 domain-containing protein [Vallitalea longa]GKX30719.1 phospholipase C [Vallitalea longa]